MTAQRRELLLAAPELSEVLFEYPRLWRWPPPDAIAVTVPSVLDACFVLRCCSSGLGVNAALRATYAVARDVPDHLVALCMFAEGALPRIELAPR